MIKNDLLLKALKGEEVDRPPVWMMRQAGRYLPEFIKLRDKYDFFTRCKTPELAAEITIQPINRFKLDAAIIFSDILVVAQAMGIDFEMKEGIGPFLENPIRTEKDVKKIYIPDVETELKYVYDAMSIVKKELDNKIPLIGFAGSPWTLFCYIVEGKGSKSFDQAKKFCFQHPILSHQLLEKITQTTINYLLKKIEHGANVIQIFDSWGGVLSPADYNEFSWPYIEKIVNELYKFIPIIVFSKGCWFALKTMSESKVSALGIDWTVAPQMARELTQFKKTLQGNLDPSKLLSSTESIQKITKEMIDDFGTCKYIVNLGHGILPNTPLQNVQAFIDTVVNYKK